MYTLELWIEMASLVNITVTIITGEDVPEDTGGKRSNVAVVQFISSVLLLLLYMPLLAVRRKAVGSPERSCRPTPFINLRSIRAPNKVVSGSTGVSNRARVAAVGVEHNTVSAGRACGLSHSLSLNQFNQSKRVDSPPVYTPLLRRGNSCHGAEFLKSKPS